MIRFTRAHVLPIGVDIGHDSVKMLQLEDDSRLGHSPLTGAKSKVVAIQPPAGFGREIWEELADKGYLKRDGVGFYELVEGK